jgi:hypothetical protein
MRPSDSAPCQAAVTLEPASAVVGEQVRYRVSILRRPEVVSVRWLRTPTFPSFRAEWLPGRTPDPRIADIGSGWLMFEERRALFPAAAGTLEIPAAQIGCTLANDIEVSADVGATFLRAEPVPERSRPEDFTGVIGPVRVRTRLSAPLVRLGDSVVLTISVTGGGNVWDAAAPFDPARALPEVDAFPRATELEFDRGEALSARRTFVWDLVPRRAGTWRIPAADVAYLDPVSRRYERAASAPLTIEVLAPADGNAAPPAEARDEPRPGPAASEGDEALGRSWFVLALALLAGGAGLAAITAQRVRRAPLRAARSALERAEAASARGDADRSAHELAHALRAALALHIEGAESLPSEELVARTAAREPVLATATALLAALDRARFAAPGSEHGRPTPAVVRAALRALATGTGSGRIRPRRPRRREI